MKEESGDIKSTVAGNDFLKIYKMNWQPTRRFPWHTCSLCLLFVFLFVTISDDHSRSARLYIPIERDGRWWLFLSCTVLHLSVSHLLSNILLILTCGSLFEWIHGPFAFHLVFWTGSFVGIAFENAFYNDERMRILLCGASAGAYALLSCHLSHLLMNWREVVFRWAWFIVIFCMIVSALVDFWGFSDKRDVKVAHVAHLFGGIQGFSIGILAVKNFKLVLCETCYILIAFVTCVTLVLFPLLATQPFHTRL